MKVHAEIGDRLWAVAYPFCAGCKWLVVSGSCNYAGPCCAYPNSRMKRPISFAAAFIRLADEHGGMEVLANRLGACIKESA